MKKDKTSTIKPKNNVFLSLLKYIYLGVLVYLKFFLKFITYVFKGMWFIFTFFVISVMGIINIVVTVIWIILKYALSGIVVIGQEFYIAFAKLGPTVDDLERKKAQEQKKEEALKLKKQKDEEKFKEQKRLIEEKRKKAEAEFLKKSSENSKKSKTEQYVNDKVKLEKRKVSDVINELMKAVFLSPSRLVRKTKNWYSNLALVKNARNQKEVNRQAILINFEGDDAKKSKTKVMYEYVIKTKEGKIVKGYFPAYSKVEVHSFLLSEGNLVYSIRTNGWIQFAHGQNKENRVKIKTKDLIFFLAQLSTYLKAGIPLVDSLKILVRQYKNKSYQRIFRSMIYDLTTGENFSSALEKQGNAFPKLLINMVKASEMTGELPETLDDMEEYYSETEATRKQMITALTYPIIIFVLAIGVGIFMMIYVVPKFVDIYNAMDNAQIPGITLAVLAISDFLQTKWWLLLIIVVVFIIVYRYLYKNVLTFKTSMQWLFMHLPGFSNILIYNEVTMFTKTFASLLKHNVFITDSMEILNQITNNQIYKMMILDTITNLAKGEKASLAFKDQWAFPVPAYEMIVTGEETGQLPEMMGKVSTYYQGLHKDAVARLKTYIEPALIIVLTAMVGVIVLSIVIPMFNMYSSIQG